MRLHMKLNMKPEYLTTAATIHASIDSGLHIHGDFLKNIPFTIWFLTSTMNVDFLDFHISSETTWEFLC